MHDRVRTIFLYNNWSHIIVERSYAMSDLFLYYLWSTISEFFPVSTGVGQRRVEAPTLFSTCMDWAMGRMVEESGCGVSFGDVEV